MYNRVHGPSIFPFGTQGMAIPPSPPPLHACHCIQAFCRWIFGNKSVHTAETKRVESNRHVDGHCEPHPRLVSNAMARPSSNRSHALPTVAAAVRASFRRVPGSVSLDTLAELSAQTRIECQFALGSELRASAEVSFRFFPHATPPTEICFTAFQTLQHIETKPMFSMNLLCDISSAASLRQSTQCSLHRPFRRQNQVIRHLKEIYGTIVGHLT